MRIAILMTLLALSGCSLFSPTYERCDATPGYASAKDVPPLKVPPGVDAPDTHNALRIPAVTTPEAPLNGRCIDAPPSYNVKQPQQPAAAPKKG